MKDYTLFFRRGYKYAGDAAQIWYKRRNKIEDASFLKYGNHIPEDKRFFKIWNELSKRIEVIGRMFAITKEKEKQKDIEAGFELIMLQCFATTCRYNPIGKGIMVHLKDYKPGTYKCDTCGKELRTKEDMEIDKTLLGMGIKTNY